MVVFGGVGGGGGGDGGGDEDWQHQEYEGAVDGSGVEALGRYKEVSHPKEWVAPGPLGLPDVTLVSDGDASPCLYRVRGLWPSRRYRRPARRSRSSS